MPSPLSEARERLAYEQAESKRAGEFQIACERKGDFSGMHFWCREHLSHEAEAEKARAEVARLEKEEGEG